MCCVAEIPCLILKIVNGSLAHGDPIKQHMLLPPVTEGDSFTSFNVQYVAANIKFTNYKL